MATVKQLLADLRGDDPDAWYRAGSEAARLTRSLATIEALCELLHRGRYELQRWEAASVLGRGRHHRIAGDALFASFQNRAETPLVRGCAAEQLANFPFVRKNRLIDAYTEGLDDPAPEVRFWCIYGLAVLKAGSARARLQHLAANDHARCPGWPRISTEAKWALAVLDDLAEQDRMLPPVRREPIVVANPTRAGFLRRAIQSAADNVRDRRGGPFGALIVRGTRVIAEGVNLVVERNDPTAHAEIVALREACRMLETFDLSGCDIYCSSEPNPMCLGAIYWARLDRIFYAASRHDAARAGFDDLHLYRETSLPIAERSIPTRNLARRAGRAPFSAWKTSAGKIRY